MIDTTITGLVGNLTADPVLRSSQAGKPWTTARLAVKPFTPGGGDVETVFVNLVMFGSLAWNVAGQLHKGDRICATGRLEDDAWTGTDGVERPGQKLIVDALGPDLRFTHGTYREPERDHFGIPVDRIDTSDLNDQPF